MDFEIRCIDDYVAASILANDAKGILEDAENTSVFQDRRMVLKEIGCLTRKLSASISGQECTTPRIDCLDKSIYDDSNIYSMLEKKYLALNSKVDGFYQHYSMLPIESTAKELGLAAQLAEHELKKFEGISRFGRRCNKRVNFEEQRVLNRRNNYYVAICNRLEAHEDEEHNLVAVCGKITLDRARSYCKYLDARTGSEG